GRTCTVNAAVWHGCTVGKDSGRIWVENPGGDGNRRDLTGEEDRAFWTWAAVETLRHTGIRVEELTELSHHSLIQYTLPGTGELVPLLQIAPSKSDTERLRGQPGTRRRAGRDHHPHPATRRLDRMRNLLRPPRTGLEPTDAAAV